eukprot:g1773.t1
MKRFLRRPPPPAHTPPPTTTTTLAANRDGPVVLVSTPPPGSLKKKKKKTPDTVLGARFWSKCEALVRKAGVGDMTPLPSPPKTVKRLLNMGRQKQEDEKEKENDDCTRNGEISSASSSSSSKISLREKKERVRRRLLRERRSDAKGETKREKPSSTSTPLVLIPHGIGRSEGQRRVQALATPAPPPARERKNDDAESAKAVENMYERLLSKSRDRETSLKSLLEKEQEKSRDASRRLERMTRRCEEICRNLEEEEARAADFVSKIKSLELRVGQLTVALRESEANADLWRSQVAKANKSRDQAVEMRDRAIDDAARMQETESIQAEALRRLEDVERDLVAYRERNDRLERRCKELEASSKQATTTSSDAELVTLRQRNQELERRCKDLEVSSERTTTTTLSNAELVTLRQRNQELERRCKDLEASSKRTTTTTLSDAELVTLRQRNQELERRCEELEVSKRRTLNDRDDARRALESVRANYESQLVDVQNELVEARRKTDVMREAMEDTVRRKDGRHLDNVDRIRHLASLEAVAAYRAKRRRRRSVANLPPPSKNASSTPKTKRRNDEDDDDDAEHIRKVVVTAVSNSPAWRRAFTPWNETQLLELMREESVTASVSSSNTRAVVARCEPATIETTREMILPSVVAHTCPPPAQPRRPARCRRRGCGRIVEEETTPVVKKTDVEKETVTKTDTEKETTPIKKPTNVEGETTKHAEIAAPAVQPRVRSSNGHERAAGVLDAVLSRLKKTRTSSACKKRAPTVQTIGELQVEHNRLELALRDVDEKLTAAIAERSLYRSRLDTETSASRDDTFLDESLRILLRRRETDIESLRSKRERTATVLRELRKRIVEKVASV